MKGDPTSPLKPFEQLCVVEAIQSPQTLACSAIQKKLQSYLFSDFQAMLIGFDSSPKCH